LYGVGVNLETSSCGRIGAPNSPTGGVIGVLPAVLSYVCIDVCRLDLSAPNAGGLESA
jgi:hypothetical protein